MTEHERAFVKWCMDGNNPQEFVLPMSEPTPEQVAAGRELREATEALDRQLDGRPISGVEDAKRISAALRSQPYSYPCGNIEMADVIDTLVRQLDATADQPNTGDDYVGTDDYGVSYCIGCGTKPLTTPSDHQPFCRLYVSAGSGENTEKEQRES